MRNPVSIHNQTNGERIKTDWLNIREAVFPLFEAEYKGTWYPASGDFDHMRIEVRVKASNKVNRPKARPSKPLTVIPAPVVSRPVPTVKNTPVATSVTYEQWRDGKNGIGPKIMAPRGLGAEWAARLYCERAISRAKYFAYTHHSKKQLRYGSYASRRRAGIWNAHRTAWERGIEIAEAVYNKALDNHTQHEGYWQGVKELVKEAFGYTSYLLALAGN